MTNFSSVVQLAVGHQLADIPLILAGIDPGFSCNDRCVILRPDRGDKVTIDWQDLKTFGRRS